MSGGVADRLDHLADAAESSGTVGEKAAEPLHEDATFARTPRPAGTGAVLKPLLPFVLAVGVAFLLDRLRGRRYGPRARRTAPLGPRWSMLQAGVGAGAGFTLLARRAAAASARA